MPQAGEIIEISVGPCFGFCPVYDVRVGADGLIVFEGERHTEVLGERRRSAGPETYRTLADDLAPFRPAPGTEGVVACDAAISDTSSYTITWTDAVVEGPSSRIGVDALAVKGMRWIRSSVISRRGSGSETGPGRPPGPEPRAADDRDAPSLQFPTDG